MAQPAEGLLGQSQQKPCHLHHLHEYVPKSFAASTEARQQPCVFQLSHKGRPGWLVMLHLAVNLRGLLNSHHSEILWLAIRGVLMSWDSYEGKV